VVDIPLNSLGVPVRWRARPNTRSVNIAMKVAFLLMVLVAFTWAWIAVATDVAQRRCDSPIGRLAVRLKLDSYYSNCRCLKPSLDFSEACNSMYSTIL
jgi:hypothetical protein